MSRFRRGRYKVLERVSNLVELLISCHPQGFGILLGEVQAPSSREIHEMMNAGRSQLPEDFKATMPNLETEAERIVYDREYFDRSVELAGGWGHIHYVSQECRKMDSRKWSVVMDHVRFVEKSASRYMSKLGYIATRYSLAPRTVTKYRKEFPHILAEMLLISPGEDDNFYLLPG
ncbi:MAG: hypothetical protein IJ697_06680 [Synergistaceae bacterium]|nr:hypothetical protein [Synergistaceae bacterium]